MQSLSGSSATRKLSEAGGRTSALSYKFIPHGLASGTCPITPLHDNRRCGPASREITFCFHVMFRPSTRLHFSILILVCWMGESRPRFDPPFQNDMRPPRVADRQIVKTINHSQLNEGGKILGLVHGHFLGDGQDSVAVAALRRVGSGFSPLTFLFFSGADGWRFKVPEDLETIAYCRVLAVGSNKDALLCQSDFVPSGQYGKGEIDTNLYTVDFTRDPSVSYFLHLEDTVATGHRCVAWASVRSLDIRASTLHVVVEYGRKQLPLEQNAQHEFRLRAMRSHGSPSGFPTRFFSLDFRIADGSVAPMASSVADYKYVTAKWVEDEAGACSGLSGPERR
jgi:hypothetical protein